MKTERPRKVTLVSPVADEAVGVDLATAAFLAGALITPFVTAFVAALIPDSVGGFFTVVLPAVLLPQLRFLWWQPNHSLYAWLSKFY